MPEAHSLGQPGRGLYAGPAGAIEVVEEHPRQGAARALALIAHPHPLYGGTLDNKVVYTLGRGLMAAGCATLRFNFRGVGHSEGTHDEGRGEGEDLLALAQALRVAYPGLPLLLAGFSFGSFVALAGCAAAQASGVLTVAPPLFYAGDAPTPDPGAPWWLIHGDADEVVDCADTQRRADAAPRPPSRREIVPGVGHFFHGELGRVRDFAGAFGEALLG